MNILHSNSIIAGKWVIPIPEGVSESTLDIVKSTLLGGGGITEDVVNALRVMMNREVRETRNRDDHHLWNNSEMGAQTSMFPLEGTQTPVFPQFRRQDFTLPIGPWPTFLSNCNFFLPPSPLFGLDPAFQCQTRDTVGSRFSHSGPSKPTEISTAKGADHPGSQFVQGPNKETIHNRIQKKKDGTKERINNRISKGKDDTTERIHSRIHYWLGTMATKQSHTPVGSGAYAELVKGSMKAIQDVLAKHHVLGPRHTMIDLGSGSGCLLFTLCHATGCRGIGIEHQPIRQLQAVAYVAKLFKEFQPGESSGLNTNVYLSLGDIHSLTYLPSEIRLGYQFDQEFPPKLTNHIRELYRRCGPKFVLSCKTVDKQDWNDAGYELIDQLTTSKAKAGSCRSNTFYLYRRMEQQSGIENDPSGSNQDIFTRAEEYFAAGFDAKLNAYADMEKDITASIQVGLKERKLRSRLCPVKECSAESWTRCAHRCDDCERQFSDKPYLVERRESMISGYGVFAKVSINAETHLCEYKGKRVCRGVSGNDEMELGPGLRIKPHSTAVHRFFNHAYPPHANARFQKWEYGLEAPSTHVSVVTTRKIHEGEEILVDYGPAKGFCTNVLALMMARTEPGISSPKLTPQLRRDSVRCEATERMFGVRVFTMDNRTCLQHLFAKKLHTLGDINVASAVPNLTFSEVFLDWYWFENGYARTCVKSSFYKKTLATLAERLEDTGSIYLPLSTSVFVRTADALQNGSVNLELQLVTENGMKSASLFQGSVSVQDNFEAMAKQPNQHHALGATLQSIKQEVEMEPGVNADDVISRWISAEAFCPGKASFIRLSKGELSGSGKKRKRK